MAKFIDKFIKKVKPQFLKYQKYIDTNNWTEVSADFDLSKEDIIKGIKNGEADEKELEKLLKEVYQRKASAQQKKEDEFKLQNDLVRGVLDRLKYFVKNAEGDHHLSNFKKFVELSFDIINTHSERVDSYINSVDISEIDSLDLKSSEISFHNELFTCISKIEDTVSILDIKDDTANTDSIQFLAEAKAPLSMHPILKEIYPEISLKMEEMGIDFESEPANFLHIYNEDAPKWNVEKHYWEQEKETLQYYVDEFKKIDYGVVIDGYYISGWMYYHMNVFVTAIPHKVFNKKSGQYESEDRNINPPLRDSDIFIFEEYEELKKQKILFMFIAATRRAAKTTLESSKLSRAITLGKKEVLCAGGSTKDLNQIGKNIRIDMQYKNAAFSVMSVTNDWKDKIEFGIKTKSAKTILLSTLNIINTKGGLDTEILAGFTPDEFIYDEVMKGMFLDSLNGLKPALAGIDGMIRCHGILSGTGSDEALSADGRKALQNPEVHKIKTMNWDRLERGMSDEDITWKEDKQMPFGTFIPAQMKVDMPKLKSNLAHFLGIDDAPNLKKIKINITDWSKSNEILKLNRDSVLKDKAAYTKEIVYEPIKPSEIFLSGKVNPFPAEIAKSHRDYLVKTGLWDRRRTLFRDIEGNIQSKISTKDLAEFPHKGGNIDAPCLLFEDLPEEKPKFGTYTGGFDDYKQDDSDTDSVGTFYVMKNEVFGDPFSNKIVASISFKPKKHSDVHEQWLMLMEAFNLNQTAFGENEDFAIKDYLDRKHLTDYYLAKSVNFTQTFNISNNLKRTYGWTPRTSKKTLFDLFVDYCNEDFEVEDEKGNIISLKGVQRIDDIYLLDEIINYTENTNVDRITAAMGANGYRHYLISSKLYKPTKFVSNQDNPENRQTHLKRRRRKNFYSKRNITFKKNR